MRISWLHPDRARFCKLGRVAYPLSLFLVVELLFFVYCFGVVVERVRPLEGHPRLHLLGMTLALYVRLFKGSLLVFNLSLDILENL